MRAVCWMGAGDVRVEDVPEPKLINARDAIVRVTSTAICGSDLHLYDGYVPTMQPSYIISHEMPLEGAPEAYRMFRDKVDECVKVVLKP